jgi:hypothetical protein
MRGIIGPECSLVCVSGLAQDVDHFTQPLPIIRKALHLADKSRENPIVMEKPSLRAQVTVNLPARQIIPLLHKILKTHAEMHVRACEDVSLFFALCIHDLVNSS